VKAGWSTAVVLAATISAAGDRVAPVAVSVTQTGIIVLGSDGRILHGDLDDASGTLRPILRGSTTYDLFNDMAAGMVNGELAIFVVGRSGDRTKGIVTRYSAQGKVVRTWTQQGVPLAGIAFDSASNVVYATGGGNSIYPIPVSATKMEEPLFVLGINMIGPVAADAAHHRLFAADLTYASAYVLDLQTKVARRVARGLGTVSALAYDSVSGMLYISDAEGRVLKLNPDSNAEPKKISTGVTLREPLGLAIVRGGDLLVGDRATGTVSRIAPAGSLVRQFH
jgi:DNA-binding beta-propeller fold protein YncE